MVISTVRSGVEPLMEKEPSKHTPCVSNPQYNIIMSLLTLYHNNSKLYGERVAYNKLTQYVSYLISEHGFTIIQYIDTVKLFTQPEIQAILALNEHTVYRHVKRFLENGLVKIFGYVGEPYKDKHKGGKPCPIYGLAHIGDDIGPELAKKAQLRYAQVKGNHVTLEVEPEKVTEIVDMVKHRDQVDHRTLESLIRQPIMKIPPIQRAEYLDRVSHKLVEMGKEVYD